MGGGQTGEIRVTWSAAVPAGGGELEHISGDSFPEEARPLFDVNTLQHLPDGFAVADRLGVARMAFSTAAG
ncbi:hypothetical protein BANRA_05466 [Klebsiella pneumoniae]|nr:hypothetical protein BANRA_05466 [Klebsiella pneumoniae]